LSPRWEDGDAGGVGVARVLRFERADDARRVVHEVE
jgi:hypothetical protein